MKWTLLLLCCLCFSAYSQDYLVMNTGDTLRGKVKIMSYDQLDRVQVGEKKNKTTLTARQVKTVFADGETYHPQQSNHSIRFMKLLKPGYLSLYAFKEENQNFYGGRYLIKKDGTKTEVPNLAFKKILTDFLGDCPELREKIKSGQYGRNDLDQIIDTYNSYIENNTVMRKETVVFAQKSAQKVEPLEKLKKTIQSQNDFDSKKDALDLIDDIIAKINGGQPVPNYLVDGLQKYLAGIEATKEDLEKVTSSLKE
jgi:hypothetical protein